MVQCGVAWCGVVWWSVVCVRAVPQKVAAKGRVARAVGVDVRDTSEEGAEIFVAWPGTFLAGSTPMHVAPRLSLRVNLSTRGAGDEEGKVDRHSASSRESVSTTAPPSSFLSLSLSRYHRLLAASHPL